MAETDVIDTWLYSTLTGDASLAATLGASTGVYADVAESEAAEPYVVYQMVAANDVDVVGGTRIITDALYQVKVVKQCRSYSELSVAEGRIDALLHLGSGTTTGGRVYQARRVRPIRYTETREGRTYRHLGGDFRIHVREE